MKVISPVEFLQQYYYLTGYNDHEIEYLVKERGWKKKAAELFSEILGVPFVTAYDWCMGNSSFSRMPTGYQVALGFYLRLMKSNLKNRKLKQKLEEVA